MSQVNPLSFMPHVSAEGIDATVAAANESNGVSSEFAKQFTEFSNSEQAELNEQKSNKPSTVAKAEIELKKEDSHVVSAESLLAQISGSQNYQTAVTPVTQGQNGEALPPTKVSEKENFGNLESDVDDVSTGNVLSELKSTVQSENSDETESDEGTLQREKSSPEVKIAAVPKNSELEKIVTITPQKAEIEVKPVLKESNLSEGTQVHQVSAKTSSKVTEEKSAEAKTDKPIAELSLTKEQSKGLEVTPPGSKEGKVQQGNETDKDVKNQIKSVEMLATTKSNSEAPTAKVDMAKALETVSQATIEPSPVAERVNQLQTQSPLPLNVMMRPEAKADIPQLHVSLRQGGEQVVQMQEMIQRFSPVMKQQLMAMVNKGIGQAEIRLDPPELGHMMVRIQVQNDQTQVQFQVANPQARDLLEQAQPRLRDMLAEQGLNLADSDVSYHDGGQQQSGGQDQGRSFSNSSNRSGLEQESSEQLSLKVATNPSSVIDYYA